MYFYLKKFWKDNFSAGIVQISVYGIQVSLNLILMQMFQGIIALDMYRFIFWLAVDIALWVVMLLLRSLRDFLQNRAVRKMNHQLRRDMTAALLQKSYQEFHMQNNGEYLSAFVNDINQIEQLAWKPFFELVGTAAQVLFSILAMITLHWSLLAVSLATAVIMMNAPKLFKHQMERLGAACAQEQAAAVGKIKDLIGGYDVLRFFGREDRFASGVEQASDQIEKPKFRLSCQKAFSNLGLLSISMGCQMLVNAWIGILSIKGIIIQSALMGGGNLCGAIYNGLNSIADSRLCFAASKPYFDKITVHAGRTESGEGMERLKDAITVDNVSFQYEKKPVLQNVTVCFEVGKKYALTGPSGCGKSTLFKLLLGWLPGYTGSIRFDGRDARDYTPKQLQRQMSYIEQNVYLFNTTIRENITLGGEFTEEQLQKALRDSALIGDIANMPDGLDTIVGEEGGSLSGGQKQRVAIARALIHRRSILLVDEGTSALDQKNADIVEKSLLANPDLTLILISHHLTDERRSMFDKVYDLP